MKKMLIVFILILFMFNFYGFSSDESQIGITLYKIIKPVPILVESNVNKINIEEIQKEETNNILDIALTEEDETNICYIAKTLYGEYRGESKEQQAAVVWCILNRVGEFGFAEDVIGVITQPSQFFGYSADNPILDYLWDISEDVYKRWLVEKSSEENIDVGRILPKEYKWFSGNGSVNIFRDQYIGGNEWDWSLESPYDIIENR